MGVKQKIAFFFEERKGRKVGFEVRHKKNRKIL